jgi:DNA-binding NtrC family response regulator
MQATLDIAHRYANSDEPVLLLGEAGTGKSSLAAQIHAWSGRGGPFVPFPVSASAEQLFHGDLFGHLKGAFTGALSARIGVLGATAAGTILLDELSAASRTMQAAMLAIFDRDAVRSLGEDIGRSVTARIIGASNVDLSEEVKANRFRVDLLDRFGVIRITVPPLRDRRCDVLPLFDHFLHGALRPNPVPRRVVDPTVRSLFETYRWPGNIRELEHVARATAILVRDRVDLTADALPPYFLERAQSEPTATPVSWPVRVRVVLDQLGGNKARAARYLGMSRARLYQLLRTAEVE